MIVKKYGTICLIITGLLVCFPVAALSWFDALAGGGIYAKANSHTYSENMPVEAFDNDFAGAPPREGNHAFTFNQYEVGLHYQGWYFAKVDRFDYFFNFSRDTFDIFYLDGNDIEFPINIAYDAYLKVQKIETQGYKFGRLWQASDVLSLRIGINYFEAREPLYGEIEGLIWQSPTRIRGDLDLDYIYTEDVVFDRPQIDSFTNKDISADISGYGTSFDIAAYWQRDAWQFSLEWFDLAGKIRWNNTPFTSAVLVSERDRIDEEGRAYRIPTLTAREGYRDAPQILPTRRRGEIEYTAWRQIKFAAEHEQLDRVRFNRIYTSYQPATWFKVRGGFDINSHEKSLELWTPYISLLVGTDRTDLKQSRNLRINASLSYSF